MGRLWWWEKGMSCAYRNATGGSIFFDGYVQVMRCGGDQHVHLRLCVPVVMIFTAQHLPDDPARSSRSVNYSSLSQVRVVMAAQLAALHTVQLNCSDPEMYVLPPHVVADSRSSGKPPQPAKARQP